MTRICPASTACPFCDPPPDKWIPTQWRTVHTGSWLERLLIRVEESRKIHTNAYLRAVRKIPKTSPVHGTRSWSRINARRHELCKIARPTKAQREESEILQSIPIRNSLVVGNLLHNRLARRMNAHAFT